MRKTIAVFAALAVAAGVGSYAGAAPSSGELTPDQERALDAGIQVAPKGSAAAKAAAATTLNPYLANIQDATTADYSYWKDKMKQDARARAASSRLDANKSAALGIQADPPPAVVHDEQEPTGVGANDSLENAEPVPAFGTAATKSPAVRILGDLTAIPITIGTLAPGAEDNGAIPLATDSGINGTRGVTTTGVLGDGPHGTAGTGTNDFDFYKLTVPAGASVVADTSGSASGTDTLVALYDAAGTLLAQDDDSGPSVFSLLTHRVDTAGTYYLAVAGFTFNGSLPADPFDPASGAGGGDTGNYALKLSSQFVDQDYFSVKLRPGDVIGAVANSGATGLTIYHPDGTQRVGSEGLDASSLYPANSPLPGGGNTTLAYVAEEAGWYGVHVEGPISAYDVLIEGYRPGAQTDRPRVKQTLFLDFDGERVNTGVWGGPGVRTLSPLASFLTRWGLTRSQENQLINRITAEVAESVKQDMIAKGLNDFYDIKVVNSRNSPDVWGQDNVSRVIVGGTIAESGLNTIGIAQYIDPGNYALEDQAVVLLDVLSNPSGAASLNTYIKAESDRLAWVSQGIGNVVAHEYGHLVGNYHSHNSNETANLMDAGGTGFPRLFGVGPDGIGGTADDADVDFVTDTYSLTEGFTGVENTLNVTAWSAFFR
ncbi:pre-peptidase C-terminal domain-containing protein [Nocardioides speluncae]|uniref:pre-peptidase C-terminal domain-containing protein n=1 Tax=Nocardioides speluncae TaxID=2670337 RepID=UPI000D685540|nr:pre-peptidase C-terminal domain-containing protein [Nocardioides speluncae]